MTQLITNINIAASMSTVYWDIWDAKIRDNVGPNDYLTNVKGQMTSWRLFLKDPEFELFQDGQGEEY